MAAPVTTPLQFFGSAFVLHTFAAAGDELALHDHDFEHASIVTAGRVLIFDGASKEVTVEAPHALVFPIGRPHGIRALTAGAAVLNVMPPPITSAGETG